MPQILKTSIWNFGQAECRDRHQQTGLPRVCPEPDQWLYFFALAIALMFWAAWNYCTGE
jgi:hypothetical protein